jgi:hypothetical protein
MPMTKIPKKIGKKCCVCSKPVFSVHSIYCQTHARLAFRMKARRFPPEAVEGVWDYIRVNGNRCYYTKMPLEMEDIKSPWFCVFDHLIPLDPNHIVLTSALINEIKTALSGKEFWFYIEQLADFIDKGKKIRKIRLAYWRHQYIGEKQLGHEEDRFAAKPKWKGKHKKCCLCGRPVFTLQSKYCRRCSHFARRLEMQRFGKKVVGEILEHVRINGYTCAYTAIALDMVNSRSPWYGVFNCLTPGNKSKVVLSCALFNEMKSDLAIQEFWYYIKQLANYKRLGTKIRKKKLVYWYRLMR